MKQLYLCLILTAALLLLPGVSCTNIFYQEAQVSGFVTCNDLQSDYSPLQPSSTFYIDSPRICYSATLSNIKEKTVVRARWLTASGVQELIAEQRAECSGDCEVGFTLTPPSSGFTAGKYRVALLISDKEKARVSFEILKDTAGRLPVISSFTATPLKVTAGQPVILAWQALDATRVAIEPAIGAVNGAGSRTVNPASDTTYTLYALNRSGASSSSLSIKVSPPVIEKADLVITEFWSSGNVLSYRIRNNGTASSCPSRSYLYKNDQMQSVDYVAPLDPGDERVEQFFSYHFSPRFSSILGGNLDEGASDAVNIRLCANADGACTETDTENNCLDHNFGPLWSLDLLRYAKSAAWQSSAGDLKYPMFRDGSGSYAELSRLVIDAGQGAASTLLICPPQKAGGWIQARIGLLHGSPARLTPFTIPHKCKFTARVGLTSGSPSGVSVKLNFGVVKGGEITYFTPVTVTDNGKTEPYQVDLSKLAGQEVEFILRAEASAPLQQGCAAWVEPTIIQER